MESADSAAVLLLDLPDSALAGIDLLSFTTTPRFRGVKDVPPGLHFAFVGANAVFSERHGIWFFVQKVDRINKSPDIVITKWNPASESLLVEKEESEVLRWRANIGSIWREGLTPYRQAAPQTGGEDTEIEHGDWQILTANITSTVLSRVTGRNSEWKLSSANSSKDDLERIPGLTAEDLNLDAEAELHFLPINLKQTWREGATGRERTDAAQDRSWALNNLIETYCTDGDANEIIGELQFCFLIVLTLNNFSCFEQWKRILTLLFTCESAVLIKPDLFISAIAALRLQLQHMKDAEGGLIDLADEGGSLLKALLVRFRKGLERLEAIEVGDVLDELKDLEDYLAEEYGWQFGGSFVRTGLLELEDGEQVQMHTTAYDEDDETGEFAPQVVDLTPAQAKLLGVADELDLPTTLTRASLKDAKSGENEASDDGDASESDESEDMQDLEEMDARF